MADYFPLIARAVGGLDKNTGENRRALYERARTALVAQLRSVEPPLEEADITRERLALEEAIRKVEADAVKRARAEEEAAHAPPQEEPPPSLRDQALRDFRETVAEAESLGGAALEAGRSARETYERMPGAAVPPHPPAGKPAPAPHYFEPPDSEPPPSERAPAGAQAGAWPPPAEPFEGEP